MTSSSDLEQIETRTLSLVRDFSFLHADDPVANSCKAVADAVAQQASRQVRAANVCGRC